MFRIVAKMKLLIILFITLVAILPVSPATIAKAQAPDQVQVFAVAFALTSGYQYRGTRVDMWTAQQPNGRIFTDDFALGLTAICTQAEPNCNPGVSGFFETGFMKGWVTPVKNQLQQYVSYASIGDWIPTPQYGLGNLNDNSWYTFQTLYSNTAQRWEAWRNGQLIWYVPQPLNFQSGAQVTCGAEGNPIGTTLHTECHNMQYKIVGGTNWIPYEYQQFQI